MSNNRFLSNRYKDENFRVCIEVKESLVGGVGVFAAEDITKGTIVWGLPEQGPIYFRNEEQVRK